MIFSEGSSTLPPPASLGEDFDNLLRSIAIFISRHLEYRHSLITAFCHPDYELGKWEFFKVCPEFAIAGAISHYGRKLSRTGQRPTGDQLSRMVDMLIQEHFDRLIARQYDRKTKVITNYAEEY